MRWLYHARPAGDPIVDRYAPASLAREGFLHTSFRGSVVESARLYLPRDVPIEVLQIDPRRLDVPVTLAETPRGPMPHVHGSIPADAVRAILALDDMERAPDRVTGTRFGFVAFARMTLLDLVGVLDPIARIASMDIDSTATCEVVAATDDPARVWTGAGATLSVTRVRPSLAEFDVVIVPGGFGTRVLETDAAVLAWLAAYPHNRLIASVCTGSLLLGAAGRLAGRRATTHHSALDSLAEHGAVAVRERVVDEGQIVTAGGVTSALDLGVHLVERLEGQDAARRIAAQMALGALP